MHVIYVIKRPTIMCVAQWGKKRFNISHVCFEHFTKSNHGHISFVLAADFVKAVYICKIINVTFIKYVNYMLHFFFKSEVFYVIRCCTDKTHAWKEKNPLHYKPNVHSELKCANCGHSPKVRITQINRLRL